MWTSCSTSSTCLFQEDGVVTGSTPVTEICAPIDIMRQQMAICLNSYSCDGDAGSSGWR